METRPCECGCGVEFVPKMIRGKEQRFVYGHNRRGLPSHVKPESRNPNTGHERARKVVGDRSRCELSRIGGCKGAIEVHHVDKDPANNDRSNLMVVCSTHHKMLDNGRAGSARSGHAEVSSRERRETPVRKASVVMDPSGSETIARVRRVVEKDDLDLFEMLAERLRLVRLIATEKGRLGIPIYDPEREEELVARAPEEVRDVYRAVVAACRERAIAEHCRREAALPGPDDGGDPGPAVERPDGR